MQIWQTVSWGQKRSGRTGPGLSDLQLEAVVDDSAVGELGLDRRLPGAGLLEESESADEADAPSVAVRGGQDAVPRLKDPLQNVELVFPTDGHFQTISVEKCVCRKSQWLHFQRVNSTIIERYSPFQYTNINKSSQIHLHFFSLKNLKIKKKV